MSDVTIIQTTTLSEIADAILDTTGRTEVFAVRDMPRIIREEVYGGGKSDGHAEGRKRGYTEGKSVGYSEGYNVGYAKGTENAKPTLRGSFVLKETPNFTRPDQYTSINFPEGSAYTYFYNGNEYEYAEIEYIEFGDDDLIYIYKRGTGGVVYTGGVNVWGEWNGNGLKFPDNDSSFRVIDIVNPVTVEQQNLYDMFMGIVENDECLPYDVGYDVGLIEGSANSTPTLIGSFVWKNTPDFTFPEEYTRVYFPEDAAYTYFYDGSEYHYSQIECIEFGDDGILSIYKMGEAHTFFTEYSGDGDWYSLYNGEVIEFPDDTYRVIDIVADEYELDINHYNLLMDSFVRAGEENCYDIGHGVGRKVGYDDGYKKGYEHAGGGGGLSTNDIISLWDSMLGDRYTEVSGGSVYIEETDEQITYLPTSVLARNDYSKQLIIIPQDKLIRDDDNNTFDLIVIPRSITNITENAIEQAYFGNIIFLAEEPPTMGWQGFWSMDGGCCPPTAIYVPDDSVDAYKAHPDYAEYVDLITPLSEYVYE